MGSDESKVIKVDGRLAAQLAACSSLSEFDGTRLEYARSFLNGLLTAPLSGLAEELMLGGTLDGPPGVPGAAAIIIGMRLAQRAALQLRPLRIGTDLLTVEEGRQISSQLRAVGCPEQGLEDVIGWR